MDATYPRHVWQEIYDNSFWNKGGGAIVFPAVSAIDQAMCHIKAKALGVPVYELFGARFSDTVEVYANGWSTKHDDVLGWAASGMAMPLETYPYFPDANDYVQVLQNPLEKSIVNGKLKVPTSPGLGAEIDLNAKLPSRPITIGPTQPSRRKISWRRNNSG